ncbi:TetR/AcrR family transcriptional regulator [Bacterioplanoides sp. SCSIO 12839]|uniref:TetR/AcrR family transcriptional regulator n=1 Tax=Bacterioplanoides sp. SCSIO 12839 TaxID=2829569 RepID=UPI002102698E|nr:TetR family transcriptional regulator [Bacterioplanoides sp. SCSIO 12839]UTW47864.1 TetR family transcriptional regulator [Bacterioplanoides sp. SCSIO 12839]
MTPGSSGSGTGEKSLSYQGRKASRAKSEHRRRLILEAALRIVIREGVRGIRHRAVAKEAEVPLAATTYYFKDIQELIVDTFTLYTEKALNVVNRFADQFYQPLQQLTAANPDMFNTATISDESINSMLDYLVAQLTDYVREQVSSERDMLVAEQAFRYEAIVNDRIRELSLMHRRALFGKIEEFMSVMKSPAPKEDAELLLGLFHSVEYTALLTSLDEVDFDYVSSTLKRHLSLLVPDLLKRR